MILALSQRVISGRARRSLARWLRRSLIGLAAGVVLTQFVISAVHPRGDFLLHLEFGRRMRADQILYEGGLHIPYPPAWAVPYVPFSFISPHLAKPIFLALGLLALVTLLWLLNDLSRDALPLKEGRHFWVIAATLLVTGRFVLRDFDDGGQNLVLLCLMWMSVWLVVQQRPWRAGAFLGLAIGLKCTAILFLGYFAIKRQWRMVASTLLCSCAVSLSPIFWQGPAGLIQHLTWWQTNVQRALSQADPSIGILGPEPLQNKSLRPSLTRYLMRLPPGHPGVLVHPWSINFLDLSPAAAGWVVRTVMLAGVFLMVWVGRSSLRKKDRLSLLWEAAIVSVVMLLYSPITWGQHCVAALPGFYLLFRYQHGRQIPQLWLNRFLVGCILVLIATNRSVIGRELSLLMESYHIVTGVLVGTVIVLFAVRNQVLTHGPMKGVCSEAALGAAE